jgi:hypothetical protein
MVRRCFVSFCYSFLFASLAYSQCYDLRSTRLYEPQGRFQEWWDKPAWDGTTGTENVRFDEPTWGRPFHFALFEIGTVRKTPQGWIQYRSTRNEEVWCDPTPKRSGLLCYSPPYQTPPPTAKIHTLTYAIQNWLVDRNGIAHFTLRDDRGIPKKIENGSEYKLLPNEFGFDGTDQTEATLDLNTGAYRFESHQYFNGAYMRRYPGTGAKFWRIDTFRAEAVLHEVPCPASLTDMAFRPEMVTEAPPELEMKATPACVVKMDQTQKDVEGQPRELWEFIQNIDQVSSPEKCIQVFDSRSPSRINDVPLVKADSH